jgi:hypothetical protein
VPALAVEIGGIVHAWRPEEWEAFRQWLRSVNAAV